MEGAKADPPAPPSSPGPRDEPAERADSLRNSILTPQPALPGLRGIPGQPGRGLPSRVAWTTWRRERRGGDGAARPETARKPVPATSPDPTPGEGVAGGGDGKQPPKAPGATRGSPESEDAERPVGLVAGVLGHALAPEVVGEDAPQPSGAPGRTSGCSPSPTRRRARTRPAAPAARPGPHHLLRRDRGYPPGSCP